MSKADHTVAYAVFNPELNGAAVTVFKMRNMEGLTGAGVEQPAPGNIATGHYGFAMGGAFSPREVEIEAWATNAAGDLRAVSVVLGTPGPSVLPGIGDLTPVDVRIWADDGVSGVPALSDDAINVGVVITRLPMAP
jgi:hypothetical protein